MLRTPTTAAVLLLTALAVGCGADGEAENDTSAEDSSSQTPAPEESEGSGDAAGGSSDFCEAFSAIGAVEDFEGAREPFAELEEVGVPKDAPADAADGLAIFADVLGRADSEEELNRLGDEVPQKDQQKVAAFFRYGTESCLAPPPAPEETPAG